MIELETLKKKIIYRANYRGTKEMDILLSKFVDKYINTFNYDELINLYEILKMDDDIIFKWFSGSVDNNEIEKTKVSELLKNFKL